MSNIMLCVDPGLRGSGAAIFKDGQLNRAAYIKNPIESGRGYRAHAAMGYAIFDWATDIREPNLVVIEHPRIYPGSGQQKGDLNDLLDVCGVGSALAAFFEDVVVNTVFPSDWKGQVPKRIMNARVFAALTAGEVGNASLGSKSKDHNTLDAIGIGLHHLGRINGKVFA